MKKNIFKLTLGLAVAVTAGYTTYASQASSVIAGVALDNVEAIAGGESSSGTWRVTKYNSSHWRCDNGGGDCCPDIDC